MLYYQQKLKQDDIISLLFAVRFKIQSKVIFYKQNWINLCIAIKVKADLNRFTRRRKAAMLLLTCRFIVIKSIFTATTLQIFFFHFSDQVDFKCPNGKTKQFENCSVDYRDMTMWCDSSNILEVPHPLNGRIHSQAPPGNSKAMLLNNSCIETVNPAVLGEYTSLLKFNADNSDITKIEKNTFSACKKLVEIVLSRNSIQKIDDDAFAGLINLQSLKLNDNGLTVITKKVFSPLGELRELDLSHNKIYELDDSAFDDLKKLEVLNLAGNSLTRISSSHFYQLCNLQILNLQLNSLTTFNAYTLRTRQLREIDLGNNNISCLSKTIFENKKGLVSIQLNNNRLKTPRSDWFGDFRKSTPQEATVSLSNNQWSCDCDSWGYWDFLRKFAVGDLINVYDVECSHPENLEGNMLSSLPESTFVGCKVATGDQVSGCPGEDNRRLLSFVGASIDEDPASSTREKSTTTQKTRTTTTLAASATATSTTPKKTRVSTNKEYVLTAAENIGIKTQSTPNFMTNISLVVVIVAVVVAVLLVMMYQKFKQKSCHKKSMDDVNRTESNDADSGFSNHVVRGSIAGQMGNQERLSSRHFVPVSSNRVNHSATEPKHLYEGDHANNRRSQDNSYYSIDNNQLYYVESPLSTISESNHTPLLPYDPHHQFPAPPAYAQLGTPMEVVYSPNHNPYAQQPLYYEGTSVF